MSTSINVHQFMLTFLVIWTLTMIASNMGQCPSGTVRVTGWGPTQNQAEHTENIAVCNDWRRQREVSEGEVYREHSPNSANHDIVTYRKFVQLQCVPIEQMSNGHVAWPENQPPTMCVHGCGEKVDEEKVENCNGQCG